MCPIRWPHATSRGPSVCCSVCVYTKRKGIGLSHLSSTGRRADNSRCGANRRQLRSMLFLGFWNSRTFLFVSLSLSFSSSPSLLSFYFFFLYFRFFFLVTAFLRVLLCVCFVLFSISYLFIGDAARAWSSCQCFALSSAWYCPMLFADYTLLCCFQ